MSILARLVEAVREKVSRAQGLVLPAWSEKRDIYFPISNSVIVNLYKADPAARAAVDFLADQAVGMGFYTTAKVPRAKKIIDEFCEQVNMDLLLQQTAREVIAGGNSFWEKVTPQSLDELHILPLTSMQSITRTKYGEILGYNQGATYGGGKLPPERIIHFAWNRVDTEPTGFGILSTLASPLQTGGESRPSMATIKAGVEKSMFKIFKKYAGPNELWNFPKLKEERLRATRSEVLAIPEEGSRFVTNAESASVQVIATDPRAKFDSYIDYLNDEYILGLQTPLVKLFTAPGFTEASANSALAIAERKVVALQRFFKRTIEFEVFDLVLEQAGLSPLRAEVRLNWGMPERLDATCADIINATTSGIVEIPEARAMLKEMGWRIEEADVNQASTPSEDANSKILKALQGGEN